MKYRFKLIESLENQMIEKNITILKKNKNNENIFSKIYKISDIFFKYYNLKNYNNITGRIELLKVGWSNVPFVIKIFWTDLQKHAHAVVLVLNFI